jgi:hypothetical protein
MGAYTSGNYLGESSSEQLVTELIRQIRYSKGFQIQTFPVVHGRPITLPGDAEHWVAYGTLLTLNETVYLTDRTKIRFMIPTSLPGTDATLVPAIYKYSGINEQTNIPECTLVAYGDSLNVEQGGWYEEALQLTDTKILTPANFYYLVYIYSTNASLSMLGNPGTHSEYAPYLSFSALQESFVGVPNTLEMTGEAPVHTFGSIYANGDVR